MKNGLYSFEKLQEIFPKMTQFEIQREYATVHNLIHAINQQHDSGQLSEEDYFYYVEPLENARMFLGGYLVVIHLEEHGFSIDAHNKLVLAQ